MRRYRFPSRRRVSEAATREREREREMGGGGHGGTTYKGYTIGNPSRWHSVTGKGLCAVMWFWILYRAKQDGPVVLGWRHPWEGHGDHSDGHGHEEH
ncbi:NADH dehydrogenase [ubiquinone] 1 beta subcomplex subunit 2 [Rhynchospora pubera]|uniref:NADH dehydrogenase [ubiquinone] 1 beta subcomplex subunit 2 n=1 Tax=Rhynchospora pubera TaxID=906938 RepID=A0AAV8GG76_9POAL|nr:NADH dehydrogenase [ubiquinone] 1 beta subcomplex subunit 2 [Rhynchospora pubera]